MAFRPKSLIIIAMASFLGGVRALDTDSKLSIPRHPLEIRALPLPPTCHYSASISTVSPDAPPDHRYEVDLNLPGEEWLQVCESRDVMEGVLRLVASGCEDGWNRKGLGRDVVRNVDAKLHDEYCRLKIVVRGDGQLDKGYMYPDFDLGCIWLQKPDLSSCVGDPTSFPWPSRCSNYDVGAQNEFLYSFLLRRSISSVLVTDKDNSQAVKANVWTAEEDRVLMIMRGEGGLTWEQIAEYMPPRSVRSLMMRHHILSRTANGPPGNSQERRIATGPASSQATETATGPPESPQANRTPTPVRYACPLLVCQ